MPKWVPRAVAIFWGGFIGTLVVRFMFHRLHSLILLLLISFFISLAVEPGANRLAKRGWNRRRATLSILLAILVTVFTFVGAVGTVVGSQVATLASNSEKYVNDSVSFLNNHFNTHIDPAQVNEKINDPNGSVQKFIRSQQGNAVNLSVRALTGLLQLFSVILFSYFLVADGPRIRRAVCARLKPDRQRRVLNVWELAINKTGGYLYSRALLAIIVAFFHWIAYQTIGTPAPVALALWMGVISQFIPVIGTYIAGAVPVLLTFIDRPVHALMVLIFIILFQQVEAYIVAPRITSRTLQLHPALAFGSALAGAALLGPVGALLALPAAAMVQAVVSSAGSRHEVIEDPLTTEHDHKQVRRDRAQQRAEKRKKK
jgi:predicted PurR-regulated permease PerM